MEGKVKYRIWKTASIFYVFSALGVSTAMLGPTLPGLEVLFNTDTAMMGLSLSLNGAGFMLGSICCGLIYDKLNSELQYMLTSGISCLSAIVAPMTNEIYFFISMLAINGICRGFIDTAGSPYILSLWHDDRKKAALLQALHLTFCVGSTVCPFIISPFLVDLPNKEGANGVNFTFAENITDEWNTGNYSLSTNDIKGIEKIKYAYVINGLCSALGFIFFAILYYKDEAWLTCKKVEKIQTDKPTDEREDSKSETVSSSPFKLKIILLLLAFVSFAIHVAVEGVPSNFTPLLVVKTMHWSVQFGGLLVAVLWGGIGFARLLAIPLSLIISPKPILCLGYVLLLSGFILLLFISHIGKIGAVVGVGLAGMGSGPYHASMMTWLAKYIAFTGVAAAVCNFGASVGKIGFFVLTGFLMQKYGESVMVYICLVGSVCLILLFFLMNIFVKCLLKGDAADTEAAERLKQSKI